MVYVLFFNFFIFLFCFNHYSFCYHQHIFSWRSHYGETCWDFTAIEVLLTLMLNSYVLLLFFCMVVFNGLIAVCVWGTPLCHMSIFIGVIFDLKPVKVKTWKNYLVHEKVVLYVASWIEHRVGKNIYHVGQNSVKIIEKYYILHIHYKKKFFCTYHKSISWITVYCRFTVAGVLDNGKNVNGENL